MVTLDSAGRTMGRLVLLPPPADLAEIVEHSWIEERRGPDEGIGHRVVPDGSPPLLVHGDRDGGLRSPRVVGARSVGVGIDKSARSFTAGVRFRAGAVAALLGIETREILDRGVPLRDLTGRRTPPGPSEGTGPAAVHRALTETVRRLAAGGRRPDWRVRAADAVLSEAGGLPRPAPDAPGRQRIGPSSTRVSGPGALNWRASGAASGAAEPTLDHQRAPRRQDDPMRTAALAAGLALLLAALPVPQDLQIETADTSELEERGVAQLRRILDTWDLGRWTFVDRVRIQSRVIPHSHPVLTLNTANLDDDEAQLASYLHENFHWFVNEHEEALAAARRDFEALFPEAPGRQGGGARDRDSTYLHLTVCDLEYRALAELLGEERAREMLEGYGHYPWVYERVLDDPRVHEVNARHGLVPPS